MKSAGFTSSAAPIRWPTGSVQHDVLRGFARSTRGRPGNRRPCGSTRLGNVTWTASHLFPEQLRVRPADIIRIHRRRIERASFQILGMRNARNRRSHARRRAQRNSVAETRRCGERWGERRNIYTDELSAVWHVFQPYMELRHHFGSDLMQRCAVYRAVDFTPPRVGSLPRILLCA